MTARAARVARPLPVVPDASWWLENVPCRSACPVHTDAGGYVTAIAQGRFEDAYRIARAPNPFPSICGRVCAALCETRCRRGAIDAPVAIRALKRFVAARFGVEAAASASRWREGVGTLPDESGKHVAIVGGGPAGLACAHDLRKLGHAVTIFEGAAQLGGMMVRGIPPFRLPRELLAAEIDGIVGLGVTVRLQTRVGRDVSMEQLLADFDAVFVAAGTGVGKLLDVEGRELPGVTTAVAFLADAVGGDAVSIGERVVVVGGGSVAFDAARTAARAPSGNGTVRSLIDAARTARRAGGREVTIVSVEGRDELAAEPDEWREAEREGVRLLHRRAVRRIVGAARVEGIALLPVLQAFASDGRFAPRLDDGAPIELLTCDTVIFAVGQEADTSFLPPALTRGSFASVDAASLRTVNPKVWAGGDIAFGPRHLIDAIADGRRVAAGIGAFLASSRDADLPDEGAARAPSAVRVQSATPWHRHWTDYDVTPRTALPFAPAPNRTMGDEVEAVLDEVSAVREAQRCLRCHVNVTLRAERCILCGLCADVCPERCIALRPGEAGTVVLSIDEARCLRCGLCVERCPPQALTMVEVTHVATA